MDGVWLLYKGITQTVSNYTAGQQMYLENIRVPESHPNT